MRNSKAFKVLVCLVLCVFAFGFVGSAPRAEAGTIAITVGAAAVLVSLLGLYGIYFDSTTDGTVVEQFAEDFFTRDARMAELCTKLAVEACSTPAAVEFQKSVVVTSILTAAEMELAKQYINDYFSQSSNATVDAATGAIVAVAGVGLSQRITSDMAINASMGEETWGLGKSNSYVTLYEGDYIDARFTYCDTVLGTRQIATLHMDSVSGTYAMGSYSKTTQWSSLQGYFNSGVYTDSSGLSYARVYLYPSKGSNSYDLSFYAPCGAGGAMTGWTAEQAAAQGRFGLYNSKTGTNDAYWVDVVINGSLSKYNYDWLKGDLVNMSDKYGLVTGNDTLLTPAERQAMSERFAPTWQSRSLSIPNGKDETVVGIPLGLPVDGTGTLTAPYPQTLTDVLPITAATDIIGTADPPSGGGDDEEDKPTGNPTNKAPALLFTKFPFCLPWDLYTAFSALSAAPVAPEWEIDVPMEFAGEGASYKINLSLEGYETYFEIARYFILLLFVVCLIVGTRKMIGD